MDKDELEQVLTAENLVYQTEDTKCYRIPAGDDPGQLLSVLQGKDSAEFTQNRRWNVAQELERHENARMIKEIKAQIEVLEGKVRQLETLLSAATEALKKLSR